MGRHVNHRGWIVIESIASPDGGLCVDLFQHLDGGYGFEHFRSDPEDMGRWTAIGGSGSTRHQTLTEATAAATQAVPWLATQEAVDSEAGSGRQNSS